MRLFTCICVLFCTACQSLCPAGLMDVVPVQPDYEKPARPPSIYIKGYQWVQAKCGGYRGCFFYDLNMIFYDGNECVKRHELDHWDFGPLETT